MALITILRDVQFQCLLAMMMISKQSRSNNKQLQMRIIIFVVSRAYLIALLPLALTPRTSLDELNLGAEKRLIKIVVSNVKANLSTHPR